MWCFVKSLFFLQEQDGKCRKCACSDNVDLGSSGNCNTTTGECLKCLYNTTGFNCQWCAPEFHGNALNKTCTRKSVLRISRSAIVFHQHFVLEWIRAEYLMNEHESAFSGPVYTDYTGGIWKSSLSLLLSPQSTRDWARSVFFVRLLSNMILSHVTSWCFTPFQVVTVRLLAPSVTCATTWLVRVTANRMSRASCVTGVKRMPSITPSMAVCLVTVTVMGQMICNVIR